MCMYQCQERLRFACNILENLSERNADLFRLCYCFQVNRSCQCQFGDLMWVGGWWSVRVNRIFGVGTNHNVMVVDRINVVTSRTWKIWHARWRHTHTHIYIKTHSYVHIYIKNMCVYIYIYIYICISLNVCQKKQFSS